MTGNTKTTTIKMIWRKEKKSYYEQMMTMTRKRFPSR